MGINSLCLFVFQKSRVNARTVDSEVYPEEFSPVSTRLYESSIASIPADISRKGSCRGGSGRSCPVSHVVLWPSRDRPINVAGFRSRQIDREDKQ